MTKTVLLSFGEARIAADKDTATVVLVLEKPNSGGCHALGVWAFPAALARELAHKLPLVIRGKKPFWLSPSLWVGTESGRLILQVFGRGEFGGTVTTLSLSRQDVTNLAQCLREAADVADGIGRTPLTSAAGETEDETVKAESTRGKNGKEE